MQKEIRKQMILRRKNFLPTLFIIALLLCLIIGLIYFTPPANGFIITLFFFLIFVFLLFLVSLLLGNTKNGLIISTAIIIFLILRMFGVGNILNLLLLSSLAILAIKYASFKK